jgi:hypothetical protein
LLKTSWPQQAKEFPIRDGLMWWKTPATVRLDPGSSLAESTANALVNRRINKLRQMRWSLEGPQRVPQTRAAMQTDGFATDVWNWLPDPLVFAIPRLDCRSRVAYSAIP